MLGQTQLYRRFSNYTMLYILFIFHISAFFFIFYSQVSHSFRSTLLTPSWQSAMQGMEEEENQDDGFRSPMKRCTSQPPWADQTDVSWCQLDVSWCQLYQLCTSSHIQITFKSVQLKTQSKIWMMEEQVWGNPIRDKLQNVSKCCKSIQICTFGRKSQGGRVLLSCICQIFLSISQRFLRRHSQNNVGTSQQRSLQPRENHQFSQQLVSDKTLSTERGQSYGGPL